MSAKAGDYSVLRYTWGSNIIEVIVPWGLNSGNIPPPFIKFWRQDGERVFTYAGSEEA